MAKVRAFTKAIQPVLDEIIITQNGVYTPPSNIDGYNKITAMFPIPIITTKNITANGTYNASDDGATGYSSVNVNVPEGIPGIIIGENSPTPSQGVDGDYYYKRIIAPDYGIDGFGANSSSTTVSGTGFTIANQNINIVGLRAYNRGSSATATIGLYTSNGSLIDSFNVELSNGWNELYFDSPIELMANTSYYVIVSWSSSGHVIYTPINSITKDSRISSVYGTYGGIPGTIDNTNIYGCDILIESSTGYYKIVEQYIKANNNWQQLV